MPRPSKPATKNHGSSANVGFEAKLWLTADIGGRSGTFYPRAATLRRQSAAKGEQCSLKRHLLERQAVIAALATAQIARRISP
jgi:hypothetical protein